MSFIEVVILLLIESISIIVAVIVSKGKHEESKPGIIKTIKKAHEVKKADKEKKERNKELEENLKKIDEYNGF